QLVQRRLLRLEVDLHTKAFHQQIPLHQLEFFRAGSRRNLCLDIVEFPFQSGKANELVQLDTVSSNQKRSQATVVTDEQARVLRSRSSSHVQAPGGPVRRRHRLNGSDFERLTVARERNQACS